MNNPYATTHAMHENTVHAKLRALAYRLTDGKGAFSIEDVYLSANRLGINCTLAQVRNALRYYAKIGPLKYNGNGWYVWSR